MCLFVCFIWGCGYFYIRIRHGIIVFSGMIWHSMMAAILFWRHIGIAAILELPPYWNCRHIGIWYHISHFCINAYAHVFSLTSLYSPFISDYRKYACSNNDIITILLSLSLWYLSPLHLFLIALVDMCILWSVLISPLFVDGVILTVESRYDRFLALRICVVCRCRPGAVLSICEELCWKPSAESWGRQPCWIWN